MIKSPLKGENLMIQKTLSDLDKDFIIVWSRFLTDYNDENFYEELFTLAKLGQIDAIGNFYALKGKQIDEISLQTFDDYCSADYLLALSNKLGFTIDREDFLKYGTFVSRLWEILKEYQEVCIDYRLDSEEINCFKEQMINACKELCDLIDRYEHLPSVKKREEAKKTYLNLWVENGDPLALENYCEYSYNDYADKNKFYEVIEKVKEELGEEGLQNSIFKKEKVLKEGFKKCYKELHEKLKANPEDMAIQFAYAKLLICMDKNNLHVSKNEYLHAEQFLNDTAMLQLSLSSKKQNEVTHNL